MNAKTEIDRLVKQAYDPKYATKGAIGSLSDSWKAIKKWWSGKPLVKALRAGTGVSSVSAPTAVDGSRGMPAGINGEGQDVYGTLYRPDSFPRFFLYGDGASDVIKATSGNQDVNSLLESRRQDNRKIMASASAWGGIRSNTRNGGI